MKITTETKSATLQAEINKLASKVELCKSEDQLRSMMKNEINADLFFYGCGGHHMWIHAKAEPNQRIAIIQF